MTQAPPMVSIIIPAFNAAQVLVETLESVRVQTFRDFEAIVVDDGSTDDTAEIARRFCEGDSRFRLLRQSNAGVSVARNTAFGQANGEWIAFLDADDTWLAKKLERQLALAGEDARANFLFTNFHFWDGGSGLRVAYRDDKPLPDGDTIRKLIFHYTYCLSAVMIRRKTLIETGPFDPELRFSQDWDMWLRIAERGLWARGTREPLARYRRWPGSRTMNRLKSAEGNVRVLEKNLRRTQRPELCPVYRRSLAAAMVNRELTRARPLVETEPAALPGFVWRAWRYEPRLRWLRWYLLLVWPGWLGGNATRRSVYRKILRRW